MLPAANAAPGGGVRRSGASAAVSSEGGPVRSGVLEASTSVALVKLLSKASTMENTITSLRTELSEATRQAEIERQARELVEAEALQLKQGLRAAHNQHATEIGALRAQLSAAQVSQAEIQSHLEALRAELQVLSSTRDEGSAALRQQIASLNASLSAAAAARSAAEQLASQQGELLAALEFEHARLKQQVGASRAALETVQATMTAHSEALQRDLGDQERIINQLQARNRELVEMRQVLKLRQQAITELQARAQADREAGATAKAVAAQATTRAEQAESALAASHQEQQRLCRLLAASDATLSDMRGALQQQASSLQALERQIMDVRVVKAQAAADPAPCTINPAPASTHGLDSHDSSASAPAAGPNGEPPSMPPHAMTPPPPQHSAATGSVAPTPASALARGARVSGASSVPARHEPTSPAHSAPLSTSSSMPQQHVAHSPCPEAMAHPVTPGIHCEAVEELHNDPSVAMTVQVQCVEPTAAAQGVIIDGVPTTACVPMTKLLMPGATVMEEMAACEAGAEPRLTALNPSARPELPVSAHPLPATILVPPPVIAACDSIQARQPTDTAGITQTPAALQCGDAPSSPPSKRRRMSGQAAHNEALHSPAEISTVLTSASPVQVAGTVKHVEATAHASGPAADQTMGGRAHMQAHNPAHGLAGVFAALAGSQDSDIGELLDD